MNTVIIYDSVYGNTGKIAEAIAAALGPEARLVRISEAKKDDIIAAGRIIIGTPTHGGRASAAIQAFLKETGESWVGKKIAVFSTGIPREGMNIFLRFVIKVLGYAAVPTDLAIRKMGAIPSGEPINLMVKDKEGPILAGEMEKAVAWSKKLS